MTCDDRRDLMLLYVLDALESDECHELEQHLYEGCPQCAGALAEARATVKHLPLALDPVEPPAETKSRLLERIGQSNGDGARRAEGGGGLHHQVGTNNTGAGRRLVFPEIVAEDQHQSVGVRRRVQSPWVAPAMAALFVVGALTTIAMLIFENQADSRRIAQLQAQVQEVEALTDHLGAREDALEDAVAWVGKMMSLIVSPATQVVSLQGVEGHEEGELWARLLWDQERNVCHIVSDVLKPPKDEGRYYRLWLLDEDEQSIYTQRFDVDENGKGTFAVDLPNGHGRIVSAVVSYASRESPDRPEDPILRGWINY